jgi:hypothetical protein
MCCVVVTRLLFDDQHIQVQASRPVECIQFMLIQMLANPAVLEPVRFPCANELFKA